MTPAAGGLLKLLGSGVNLAKSIAAPRQPIEGASFADLLDRAASGIRSGQPVNVAASADVELDADQRERLAAAVDRLEAKGASTGLVLLDGMALQVDVLSRAVIGRADLESGEPVANIDAVVRAEARAEGTSLASPALPTRNASLLDALGRGEDAA